MTSPLVLTSPSLLPRVVLLLGLGFMAQAALAQPISLEERRLFQSRVTKERKAQMKQPGNKPFQVWQTDKEYAADLRKLEQVFAEHRSHQDWPLSKLMLEIALSFQGTKYEPGVLDISPREVPVFYLQGLDCNTHIQNSLAMALAIKRGKANLAGYMAILEELRYQNGRNSGFASRLHYTSQWLRELESRKLGVEISNATGMPFKQRLCKLTGCQPVTAKDDSLTRAVAAMETRLNAQPQLYWPHGKALKMADSLRAGDLVALTGFRQGIDVEVLGIVVQKDGANHLLYAGSFWRKTAVSIMNLQDLLWHNHQQFSGMKVLRLND